MTIEQAKALKRGDRVHYTGNHPCSRTVGPKGGVKTRIMECRVSGEPRTWVRSNRVYVPVQYGMYTHGHINAGNLEIFHLPAECPALTTATEKGA